MKKFEGYLQSGDAHRRMGVSRQHLNYLLNDGRVQGAFKDNNHWYVPDNFVDKFVAGERAGWRSSRQLSRDADGNITLGDTSLMVYEFILRFCEDNNGLPPSHSDIVDGLELSSTSVVNYHLRKLEEAGKIERLNYHSRNMRIIGGRWYPPETVGE